MRESARTRLRAGGGEFSVPTATVLRCMSPVVGPNGHPGPPGGCLLSGVKPTSLLAVSWTSDLTQNGSRATTPDNYRT